jgi:hypothetical protein
MDRQRARFCREGPGSHENATGNCLCGRRGINHPDDVVALQRPARGQRLDIAGEQRRVWHGLLSPHWRREGRSLRQQTRPPGNSSIWIRAYWPDKAILDGTWKPPVVEIAK